jgi:methylenetetrahydrofolate dehydrogenase (NADP+) / methenyltetrahydrofolate cyclohydrolase
MSAVILDGTALAARRRSAITARAADVLLRRGQPPTLLIVAFEDEERRVPHVAKKVRESRDLGIHTVLLAVAPDESTDDVLTAMRRATAEHEPDAVFVQVPIPDELDSAAIISGIPHSRDVDVMTPGRVARYLESATEFPPVTVEAAMTLLDAYDVETVGRRGVMVAAGSPFAHTFREALIRRGARAVDLLDPSDARLDQRTARADLIVAAAGVPSLLQSASLSPRTVALDIGYFNAGGRGDIELNGIEHLDAIMPVPGGVGPMTVSVLLERVVQFAEASGSSPAQR